MNIKWRTLSGLKRVLRSVIVLPAVLKTVSLGALVAGTAKYLRANTDSRGYVDDFFSHQLRSSDRSILSSGSPKYLDTSSAAEEGRFVGQKWSRKTESGAGRLRLVVSITAIGNVSCGDG